MEIIILLFILHSPVCYLEETDSLNGMDVGIYNCSDNKKRIFMFRQYQKHPLFMKTFNKRLNDYTETWIDVDEDGDFSNAKLYHQ